MQMRHRPKKRSSRRVPAHLARHGSMSSVTDSTMSLNIITVTLNMDTGNFLGISIGNVLLIRLYAYKLQDHPTLS